jgi:hypothetical protein
MMTLTAGTALRCPMLDIKKHQEPVNLREMPRKE